MKHYFVRPGGKRDFALFFSKKYRDEVMAVVFVILLGGVFMTASATQRASMPIPYQGRLLDSNYATVADGTYNMKFAIYDSLAATTGCQWMTGDSSGSTNCTNRNGVTFEPPTSPVTATVSRGLFTKLLGDATSANPEFTAALQSGTSFLEVWICETSGGGCSTYQKLTPRKQLGGVPYAYNSDELDGWDPATGISGGMTLTGGTATTDDLILQSTSGVGATGATILLKVGNNGGTTALTINNDGTSTFGSNAVGMGALTATTGTFSSYGSFNRTTAGTVLALTQVDQTDSTYLSMAPSGLGGGAVSSIIGTQTGSARGAAKLVVVHNALDVLSWTSTGTASFGSYTVGMGALTATTGRFSSLGSFGSPSEQTATLAIKGISSDTQYGFVVEDPSNSNYNAGIIRLTSGHTRFDLWNSAGAGNIYLSTNGSSLGALTATTGTFSGDVTVAKASGNNLAFTLNQSGVYSWSLYNFATTGNFAIQGGGSDWLQIAKTTGAVTIPGTLNSGALTATTGTFSGNILTDWGDHSFGAWYQAGADYRLGMNWVTASRNVNISAYTPDNAGTITLSTGSVGVPIVGLTINGGGSATFGSNAVTMGALTATTGTFSSTISGTNITATGTTGISINGDGAALHMNDGANAALATDHAAIYGASAAGAAYPFLTNGHLVLEARQSGLAGDVIVMGSSATVRAIFPAAGGLTLGSTAGTGTGALYVGALTATTGGFSGAVTTQIYKSYNQVNANTIALGNSNYDSVDSNKTHGYYWSTTGGATGISLNLIQQYNNGAGATATRTAWTMDQAGAVTMGALTATTGTFSATIGAVLSITATTGTNHIYQYLSNTGGSLVIGRDDFDGGNIVTGSLAYSAIINNQGANAMHFGTSDAIRMTIASDGTVGIGTTAPLYTLDVAGSTLIAARGSEKVTNGNFSSGGTNWTFGSSWTIGASALKNVTSGTDTLYQDIGAVAGETYVVSFTVSTLSSGTVTVSVGGTTGTARSANGSYTEILSAVSTANLTFTPSNPSYFAIDDISVKKLGAGNLYAMGNVGVGTTNPSGLLHVGSALSVGTLYLDNQTGYGSRSSKMWINYSATDTDSNTWSGGAGLTIHNNDTTDANWSTLAFSTYEGAADGNNVATGAIRVRNTSRTAGQWARGDMAFFTMPDSGLLERMRITYDGNVGIGTTGPDRKLDILDASSPQLRLTQADGSVYSDFQMNSSGDLIMNVDGATNQLVLDNSGNVGIGTTTPRSKLQIDTNGYPLDLDQQGAAGDAFISHNAYFNSGYITGTAGDALSMKWDATHGSFGSRGIGFAYGTNGGILFFASTAATTADTAFTPTARMKISNAGAVTITALASGSVKTVCTGVTDTAGTLSVGSSASSCDPSDLRLKTNIVPLTDEINVLDALNELHGVYFNWKTDVRAGKNLATNRKFGLIAQDVEKIFPELVSKNNSGYKGLEYDKLTAFLIEVAKAQQLIIDPITKGVVIDKNYAGDPFLTIDKDGHIGIGTKTPTATLDVHEKQNVDNGEGRAIFNLSAASSSGSAPSYKVYQGKTTTSGSDLTKTINRLMVEPNALYSIEAKIVQRNPNNGNGGSYTLKGVFKTSASIPPMITRANSGVDVLFQDSDASTVDFDAAENGVIKINVISGAIEQNAWNSTVFVNIIKN